MRGTFNSYNIATTGMYASQAALTTVSHNLSNVNTTGYSRQRVTSAEQSILTSSTTSYGSGVKVEEIERQRDSFLDQTYRQAKTQTEYYNAKSTLMEDAQKLLDEYGSSSDSSTQSENGLQQTIHDFFDSWDQLSKDPDGQTERSSVLESAQALVDTVSQINDQLTEMQQDAANRVKDNVKSLNDKAQEIAKLNLQIVQTESSGNEASDLRDQRDQLADEMSALADISAVEDSSGSLNVSINGISLVQGITAPHTLEVAETGNAVQVKWAELNIDAKIGGGSICAYREEANQTGVAEIANPAAYDFKTSESTSCIGILRQGLNDLMTTIADKVNSYLESGKDLDGSAGTDLFVKIDDNKSFMVGNIQLNPAITKNKIAAGTSGAAGDYTIASKINALQDDKDFTVEGLSMDVTDYYQSLISWAGTTGDTLDSNYDTQNLLLQQAQSQRDSISSVSQDEEMSKMIVYQNAYNASARVLNTIDSLIGDLIEDLGK